jgi:hypothetical protein
MSTRPTLPPRKRPSPIFTLTRSAWNCAPTTAVASCTSATARFGELVKSQPLQSARTRSGRREQGIQVGRVHIPGDARHHEGARSPYSGIRRRHDADVPAVGKGSSVLGQSCRTAGAARSCGPISLSRRGQKLAARAVLALRVRAHSAPVSSCLA